MCPVASTPLVRFYLQTSLFLSRNLRLDPFQLCHHIGHQYANILTETKGRVAIITLNRPDALNALNSPLMKDLNDALRIYDADEGIGAIVVTGSEKAFAGMPFDVYQKRGSSSQTLDSAGADIKEMQPLTFIDNYKKNFIGDWTGVTTIRKPILAAVNGFAVGSVHLCPLSIHSRTN